jgi:hypothetical protein
VSIQSESFSDLLHKYTLIVIELSRLNALMVYYSDCGNSAKFAAAVDAIKRLDMSKSAIAIELDKRMPNGPIEPNEDELRPPA